MRINYLIILILLCLSLLAADYLNPQDSILFGDLRDTSGTLSFSVRTVTYNGPYGPRNAGVIWITNSQNQFVKTIKIWANTYRYTLIRWIASSGQNTTGAITSASLNNHQLHNISWNGKNHQNQDVPDGEYKINVEFTEHNASAANMGKFKQITFVKGPNPINQTVPNETYFRDMSLIWEPVIQNGTISGFVRTSNGSPVSGAIVQAGAYSTFSAVDGSYSLSVPPGMYTVLCVSTGYEDLFAYDIAVNSSQTTSLDFTLQAVSNSDDLAVNAGLVLHQVYPNPTISEIKLKFNTDSAHPFNLDVYNVRGQRIFSQKVTPASKGLQEINWSGKDSFGNRCPVGIYNVKISQNGNTVCQKVTLR